MPPTLQEQAILPFYMSLKRQRNILTPTLNAIDRVIDECKQWLEGEEACTKNFIEMMQQLQETNDSAMRKYATLISENNNGSHHEHTSDPAPARSSLSTSPKVGVALCDQDQNTANIAIDLFDKKYLEIEESINALNDKLKYLEVGQKTKTEKSQKKEKQIDEMKGTMDSLAEKIESQSKLTKVHSNNINHVLNVIEVLNKSTSDQKKLVEELQKQHDKMTIENEKRMIEIENLTDMTNMHIESLGAVETSVQNIYVSINSSEKRIQVLESLCKDYVEKTKNNEHSVNAIMEENSKTKCKANALEQQSKSVQLKLGTMCRLMATRFTLLNSVREKFSTLSKNKDKKFVELHDKITKLECTEKNSRVGFCAFVEDKLALDDHTIITSFDRLLCNMGGHFNPLNGVFTVPVTGLYFIAVTVNQTYLGNVTLGVFCKEKSLIATRESENFEDSGSSFDEEYEESSLESSLKHDRDENITSSVTKGKSDELVSRSGNEEKCSLVVSSAVGVYDTSASAVSVTELQAGKQLFLKVINVRPSNSQWSSKTISERSGFTCFRI